LENNTGWVHAFKPFVAPAHLVRPAIGARFVVEV